MILFNVFFPIPGEHILSWLVRLAEANGFYDFSLFCEMFIFDGDKTLAKKCAILSDTGFSFPVGNLLKHFLPDFAEKISAEGILHQNTNQHILPEIKKCIIFYSMIFRRFKGQMKLMTFLFAPMKG